MIRKSFFVLVLFSTLAFASSEEFAKKMHYFTDYNSAVKYSINKYKPLMMTIVTTTCPWCKKLENQILQRKNIDDFVKANFTPILLNRDTDSYPKDKFNATAVPTTFFIDPIKQKIIYQIRGYKSKKEFLKHLEIAKNKYDKGVL